MMIKNVFTAFYVFSISLVAVFFSLPVFAQEQNVQPAKIISVQFLNEIVLPGGTVKNVKYTVLLENNQEVTFEQTLDPGSNYLEGDNVLILVSDFDGENTQYFVTDHVRLDGIFVLFVLFLVVVIAVSKVSGILSLLGMVYSFGIIFWFLLPSLNAGVSPIIATLLSIVLIAPVTFILSHGINKKTLTAILSTFIALGITALIATYFIKQTHLTGYGSEEASFLGLVLGNFDMRGLFLAGIIIGTLGILDDATVTQASIVSQLKNTVKDLNKAQIFSKAMAIGHDHIASTVNTLILVYTGASLPLLLLFLNSNETFGSVLNSQLIAEEVVTMLVSSIGLIISIPISTYLAAYLVDPAGSDNHSHHHH